MEVPHPRASWEGSGDRWYRKTQVYTAVFDRDLDLDNYIVVGAPYAGAIALWRDDSKIQAFRVDQSKPSIDIHNLSGKKLRTIPWDKGAIKGLGWSEEESLVVVTADGTVRCYDLQGEFTQFSLGNGADNYGVDSCRFYSSGMVALLGNQTLVTVASYAEPRPKLLAPIQAATQNVTSHHASSRSSLPNAAPTALPQIHSWTIIPPAHALSRSVEVLLSVDRTVLVVDASACEDRLLDIGPFSHVAASPDGTRVALYSAGRGTLNIVTADFQERLVEHNAESSVAPRFVGWCGVGAALVAWEDEVKAIGCADEPGGGTGMVSYLYDSNRVHVVEEHDGARLITNDFCEFLERVPTVSYEVFAQSTKSSPASILLEAVHQLELQSPKADDYIQQIRANLTEAVDTCVNASGREFNVHWQKQLLKAASFGKSILDLYSSDDFVDMCETLRVLNAVRFFEIGMPLSYDQLQRLNPDRLVRRLLNRHSYLLALRIAAYLRLPTARIYVHWASAKVRASTDDDATTRRIIVEKLSGRSGISFEEIARAAYDEGRAKLATELLDHEPRGGRQVPLLLTMEEDELALDKAIESGDSDLVLTVLHTLRNKLPLAAFFRVLNSRPMASALVEAQAAREKDTPLLKDLYYQDDRRLDGAAVFVRESLAQPDVRTAADKLALAAKVLGGEGRDKSVGGASTTFEAQALREASALLRVQEAIGRDFSEEFVGLSVADTMFKLLKLGNYGRAKKLQAEFKVPETVGWWVRLRALVAKRDWNELEEVSRTRKSPIGWEPFYNLILQAGNPKLASVFIPKCTGLEAGITITMYEKCGMKVKAAEEAVRLKDRESWERLLASAGGASSQEGREIERAGKATFAKK